MEEAIVVSRLCRWAKWKLGSGKHLGFKPQVNFIRLAGEEAICPNCDDDRECIETNDAVEQLPELHKLLIRIEYLSTARTDKERAFVLGISRQSYISYRSMAYNIIGMFFEKTEVIGLRSFYKFSKICIFWSELGPHVHCNQTTRSHERGFLCPFGI